MKHWILLLLLSRATAHVCLQTYCNRKCLIELDETQSRCLDQSEVNDLIAHIPCSYMNDLPNYQLEGQISGPEGSGTGIKSVTCSDEADFQCPSGRTQDHTTCVLDCQNGYKISDDGTTCVPDCQNGYKISDDGTTCVLDCQNGYKISDDGTTCVPDCTMPVDPVWTAACPNVPSTDCVDGTDPNALAVAYQSLNGCS